MYAKFIVIFLKDLVQIVIMLQDILVNRIAVICGKIKEGREIE